MKIKANTGRTATKMFIPKNLSVNEKNHLVIGGCDTVDLAKEYGTPLYVMDEEHIRTAMRAYKNSLNSFYGGNGLILYASKALSTMYMYKIASEEGLGADVVSGGELYTALKSGFDSEKIYFHGNNKTYDELEFAIGENVGRIVADNARELDIINEICEKKGKTAKVLFRIKPGVDAHTHEFISTGQIDSKFGVAIENGEAFEIVKYAKSLKNLEIAGLHCHIGSQIFSLAPFKLAAKIMIEFAEKIKNELGVEISELNLGGGFGIKYIESDTPPEYEKYIEEVSKVIKTECAERNIKMPFILMEPGRSLVGDAGITLYTAGTVKDIKNVRKYVSVDGGMGDNPRYILYGAEYDAAIANRANETADEVVTICGKCCESGDIIIKDAKMPKINSGDIVAVMSTGAYNYSMASNYNRLCRPAMVFVKNGKASLKVKRETYEDLIKNDIL